ncbi:MAG: hypothetical protein ACRD0P_21180, partial [Stackebrandtia sp.]
SGVVVMATKTRTNNRNWGGYGRTGRLAPARRGDIPDLRLRPYRRWWVQLLLVIWRWRTELVALAAVVYVWTLLNGPLGYEGALIALTFETAVVITVPHSRRLAWPRVMCVVSRHRLRTCMSQLAVSNRDGRLPWIVWIRPTPVGERAWLWMITGLSVDDIKNRTEALSAACWARETRIERARTRAMFVKVDVIRRDPLTEPKPIDNPLMDGTRHVQAVEPAQVIDLINTKRVGRTTERRPVPRPVDRPHQITSLTRVTSEGTKPSTKTATDADNTAQAVEPDRPRIVTRHGEDVSDYV